MTDQQPTPAEDDRRPNKDWLQIWYQNAHSDLQWAKEQSWNGLQWSVILLAALFAASQQFKTISACVWVVFIVAIAGSSTWWQIDLHIFGRRTRETSEKLVAPLSQRTELLPRRSFDPHHVTLLVIRIAIILAAAVVSVIEVLSSHKP